MSLRVPQLLAAPRPAMAPPNAVGTGAGTRAHELIEGFSATVKCRGKTIEFLDRVSHGPDEIVLVESVHTHDPEPGEVRNLDVSTLRKPDHDPALRDLQRRYTPLTSTRRRALVLFAQHARCTSYAGCAVCGGRRRRDGRGRAQLIGTTISAASEKLVRAHLRSSRPFPDRFGSTSTAPTTMAAPAPRRPRPTRRREAVRRGGDAPRGRERTAQHH